MLPQAPTALVAPLLLLLAARLALCGAADEYVLFDVRTKLNAEYVTSAFSEVDVRHIFKVTFFKW